MKKIIYYALLLFFIIIILPLLVVRGCSANTIHEYEEEKITGQESEMVRVLDTKEDKVLEMDLEQYVRGVVAAEMPADFELEALKAQAVAARTYMLGRVNGIYGSKDDVHKGANICTNPAHCQAWISKQDAYKRWSAFSAKANWDKITRAVVETKGIIIKYNNVIANPFYHSNSGGRTENIEDVWGGRSIPYLKSVESRGEEAAKEYKKTISLKEEDFVKKLEEEYGELEFEEDVFIDNIEILTFTEGGRINTLKVGNKVMKGTDIRRIFSLNSANFKIEEKKKTIYITTVGNGHGVGMSQWGANHLAKEGMDFQEILKYYYKGVELETDAAFNAE
ncbi:MAG TPA: stage II sporulation protein D [Pseudobacteroides sp.]|uniref:stage II sporulation protein D n=1 Tax=Pseudobacteroides sp. TaxID=1968840 RepID=UPI002F9374D4